MEEKISTRGLDVRERRPNAGKANERKRRFIKEYEKWFKDGVDVNAVDIGEAHW